MTSKVFFISFSPLCEHNMVNDCTADSHCKERYYLNKDCCNVNACICKACDKGQCDDTEDIVYDSRTENGITCSCRELAKLFQSFYCDRN